MLKNCKIALASLQMYYCWVNINASVYNNNKFSYVWSNGTTYDITLPDGNYEISDINYYLQLSMIANKHYMIDSTGSNVYFLALSINPTYYNVQVASYQIPTSAQATTLSYTLPSGVTWSSPVSAYSPQLIVSSTNNFKKIIGFNSGSYPSSYVQTGTYTKVSDFTPQVSPLSCILVHCNLINNNFSSIPSVMYTFTDDGADYGGKVSINPNNLLFNDVPNGAYNYIELRFTDQSNNSISFLDPAITILLVLQMF